MSWQPHQLLSTGIIKHLTTELLASQQLITSYIITLQPSQITLQTY